MFMEPNNTVVLVVLRNDPAPIINDKNTISMKVYNYYLITVLLSEDLESVVHMCCAGKFTVFFSCILQICQDWHNL